MITFKHVEKVKGHKRSTLTAAARTGKLRATLVQNDIGIPVWYTTMFDVTQWERTRKRGRPAKKA